MRRAERAWGKIRVRDPRDVECPLCRSWQRIAPGILIPPHQTPGGSVCDGSSRTLKGARELAEFRLRAHP